MCSFCALRISLTRLAAQSELARDMQVASPTNREHETQGTEAGALAEPMAGVPALDSLPSETSPAKAATEQ
jgi:hypothetical protein